MIFFALSSLQGQLFSIPRVFIKKTEIKKKLEILGTKRKKEKQRQNSEFLEMY